MKDPYVIWDWKFWNLGLSRLKKLSPIIEPILKSLAAIFSTEDIESTEKQVNQLEDITVSATRVEKPLY